MSLMFFMSNSLFFSFFWKFPNLFVFLQTKWEGPALEEEALCSKLVERKPEKFLKQADNDRESTATSTHCAWSCISIFLYWFSLSLRSGTGKSSAALLSYVEILFN